MKIECVHVCVTESPCCTAEKKCFGEITIKNNNNNNKEKRNGLVNQLYFKNLKKKKWINVCWRAEDNWISEISAFPSSLA